MPAVPICWVDADPLMTCIIESSVSSQVNCHDYVRSRVNPHHRIQSLLTREPGVLARKPGVLSQTVPKILVKFLDTSSCLQGSPY
jgi:hypothetical protein